MQQRFNAPAQSTVYTENEINDSSRTPPHQPIPTRDLRAGDEQVRRSTNPHPIPPRRRAVFTHLPDFPSLDPLPSPPPPPLTTPAPVFQNPTSETQTVLNVSQLERTILNLEDDLRIARERLNEPSSIADGAHRQQQVQQLQQQLAEVQEEYALLETSIDGQLQNQRDEFFHERYAEMRELSKNVTGTVQSFLSNVPRRLHQLKLATLVEQVKKIEGTDRFADLFTSSDPQIVQQNIRNELSSLFDEMDMSLTEAEANEDPEETIQLHIKYQTQLQNEINDLQRSARQKTTTVEQLQQKINQLTSELIALRDTNDRLVTKSNLSEEALRAIHSSERLLEIQHKQLLDQIQNVQRSEAGVQILLEEAQENIQRLEHDYIQSTRTHNEELGHLREDNTQIHIQNNNLHNDLQTADLLQRATTEELMDVDEEVVETRAENGHLEAELVAANQRLADLAERAQRAEMAEQEALRLLHDAWENNDGEPGNDPPLPILPVQPIPAPQNRLTKMLDKILTCMKWICSLFPLWGYLAYEAYNDNGKYITITTQLAREYDLRIGRIVRIMQRFNQFHLYLTRDQLKNLQSFLPANLQSSATTMMDLIAAPLEYRDQLLDFIEDLPTQIHSTVRSTTRKVAQNAVRENINEKLGLSGSSLEISPKMIEKAHNIFDWTGWAPAFVSDHGREKQLLENLRRAKLHRSSLKDSYTLNREHHQYQPIWDAGKAAGMMVVLRLGARMTALALPAVFGFHVPLNTLTPITDILSAIPIPNIVVATGSAYVRNQARIMFNPDAAQSLIQKVLPSLPQMIGVTPAAWYDAMKHLIYFLFGIGRQVNGDDTTWYQTYVQLIIALSYTIPICVLTFRFVMQRLMRLTAGNEHARRYMNSPIFITALFTTVAISVFTDAVFNQMSAEERNAILATIPTT